MKQKNIALDAFAYVLRKKPWLSALLVVASVGVVLFSLAPAHMLRRIIDDYILPGRYDGILLAAAGYFLLLFLNDFFDFLKNLSLVLFGQRLYQYLQERLSDKLTRLKTQYYTGHNAGETASYFINDVDTINSVFTTGVIGILIDCLKVAGILGSIYLFSPTVMLVVCLFLPVILLITRILQKMMLAAQLKSRSVTGNINSAITETKEVFPMVKLGGKEGFMTKRWNRLLDENYAAAEQVNLADSISSPIPQVLKAVAIGAVVYLASGGIGLTVGMLAASIELITNLFDPLEAIASELQSVQKAISGVKRLNAFYNQEEETREEAPLPEGMITGPLDVTFDQVGFSYVKETPVLKNVSFSAQPRSKLAIAGRTGVGKTTIFNLITGLYEPGAGQVRIGGIPAGQIPRANRRAVFAYVSQSFLPVIGTVLDQVTLQDSRVTRKMAYRACALTGLHEEIEKMEGGYDAVYAKGLLSEGQEQLLNIARAIVMEPKIFLLDEMSARLDSFSEARIQDAIDSAGEGMTVISISHRLSSILFADQVIYIRDGAVERTLDLRHSADDRDWVLAQSAIEEYRLV